ncbi:elongator complex protein 1 [Tothia fuscella]|uniref:Elongator complex protein 1 n=1 Tax=Tothia fuscella TaxID=1048955 RepID=A0A9P4NET3_9PEZI|nr:elongator complex protein 1 [Tothia fuscella]
MRNLRNTQRSTINFPNPELSVSATTWDTSSDSLICAFGPTETNIAIQLRRVKYFPDKNEEHHLIASWDAPCPHPDLTHDTILNIHHFPDTAITTLILAGGDIVLVREDPLPGEQQLEIAGTVDAGITAAAWSPDEELLIIATKADTLLFMSRDFENIADVAMSAEDVKASNHVSVGWGKTETQFKGRGLKTLRDPTMPEKVDEGLLSKGDDGGVRISWRGDGAYVTINSIEGGKRRMIRVYSREGTLDSVSEPVDGLEGPLSWRPAGNIIAGVRRLEESTEVVFFERNGLRHGEFSLRNGVGVVKDLFWNVDSMVLAIVLKDRVQFWTMGNYHYYLKQEIRLAGKEPELRGLCWHSEKALRVAAFGSEQIILTDYAFQSVKGPTSSPYDFGITAVIDGSNLKLTPLRNANIPPPMSLHELRLESNIIDVTVGRSSTALAILDHAGLNIYDYKITSKSVIEPILRTHYALPDDAGIPIQVALMGDTQVSLLTHSYGKNRDKLYRLDGEATTAIWELVDLGVAHIASIFPSQTYEDVYIQNEAGQILPLPSAQEDSLQQSLPVLCPWTETVTVGKENITFGLSSSGSLYAGRKLLVSNCTSFLVTPAHLIFTTTQHLLKFVHLTSVEALEIPPNEPETDERCRSIERGARLVTVMPSAYSLILQMPRGNLETIYPRALVLAGIRKSIAAKKFKKAFMACRNHRVDMNIIHDHAPKQFMDNVALFVDQVRKVEHIDLFLSQLRDEDVSRTMYKETIQAAPSGELVNGDATPGAELSTSSADATITPQSKINRICDAFLSVLQSRTSTNLQNIVTANVCKSPPDLDGGLNVISKIREHDEDLAEKSAEHICFLADGNQLYDTSLGVYDLDLTLLIAQQSQKDPREYLPYLQNLQELEPLRKRFTIDNDLGRYKKALSHLHEMDAFDEIEKYAEKHELYSTAIELYKYQEQRLKSLMRLYANFLTQRNRFKEAGIAYDFLLDYASAIPCYRQANLWREALSCATLLPLPENELTSLAEDLADGLTESKEYQAAAVIFLDYLSSVEEAAKSLCKAYLFAEATRVIGLHRQPQLLGSTLDPGLIEAFNSTTELLADCKTQLNAQVPRLRELRLKKESDPLAFYAGDAVAAENWQDFPDNISLAPTDATTSGGTFMTRYTNRTSSTLNTQTTRKTSKNRRREERKRARGKKGSVYEEEYLINSIGRLIERINSTADEAGRLVEGLVKRGMRERAVAVEKAMSDVVKMCRNVVDEVFGAEDKGKVQEGDNGERPMGGDGVLWDALESVGKMEKPVVKKFDRLSLLD